MKRPGARAMLLAASVALCGVVLGVLVLGAASGIISASESAEPADWSELWSIGALARTVGVAGAIAAMATLLAAPVAWALRRASPPWIALGLVPLMLPPYLVYGAWNLLRSPGTWLGDMLEGGSAARWTLINHAQAMVSLALWSWPLSAALLTGWTRRIDQASLDALALETPSRARRAAVIARMCLPGALVAFGAVFLLMLGTAIPLQLAQVETYAITLSRRIAEGASQRELWLAAAPLLGAGVVGAWILAGAALNGRFGQDQSGEGAPERAPRLATSWAVLIWIASSLVPIGVFAWWIPGAREVARFRELLGESTLVSLALGAGVGACAALVAAGINVGLLAPERSASRRIASTCFRAWIVAAFAPGVLLGSAILRAANVGALRWLADSWAGVGIGHLARFGAIGAVAGWWLAVSEPRSLRDLERLYAGEGLRAWLQAGGGARIAGILSAGCAVGILSVHEIEVTVVAAPPGTPSLAERLLSMLHYLRDDQLSVAMVVIGGGGLLIACAAAVGFGGAIRQMRGASPARWAPLLGLMLLLVGGCRRSEPHAGAIPTSRVVGETGRGSGQFLYPRAIDCAPDGTIWVIDKSGHVQHLTPDGKSLASWLMPRRERGKPCGVTVGPDGLLYVADTHEYRVAVFDPAQSGDAPLVKEWGSYGDGPGQFIYPTDVAIVPNTAGTAPERIYVSEYGGHDRISAFGPSGQFLFSFGSLGYSEPNDPEVCFSRPQSVIYEPSGQELIVADSANHRVGRFTLDGKLVAWIGRKDGLPGKALGEFAYPYGLARLSDGTILVAEFGGCRVQRIDPRTGAGLEEYGAPGREIGQLVTPWAVAAGNDEIFILDSGNNRVQVMPVPARLGGQRADAR